MIDEEIFKLRQKIANIEKAKESLNTLYDKASETLKTIKPIKDITDTQLLANDTIDRGKMEYIESVCNNIIAESSKEMTICRGNISSIQERINILEERRRAVT